MNNKTKPFLKDFKLFRSHITQRLLSSIGPGSRICLCAFYLPVTFQTWVRQNSELITTKVK